MENSYNFEKYQILDKISVGNKSLILFESYPSKNCKFDEIYGAKVFLFDKNMNFIWQIEKVIGCTNIASGKFEVGENKSAYIRIAAKDRKYTAENFQGDIFEIDLENGKTTHLGWGKN